MKDRAAEIGKITQSMCEAVRKFLEMLPHLCLEMRDVSLATLGPFMHVDAWSPVWSEDPAEREGGTLHFETTLEFAGNAEFFPEYPPLREISSPGLLNGVLRLDLRRHNTSGFPGRYYEVTCTWVPHLQTFVFKVTYDGAIPPVR